jgi:cytochrome c-type biogenesis protein
VSSVTEIVYSGGLLAAMPLALLAGLISFLSPCILPLVPGYLGFLGGASVAEGRMSRRRLLVGVLLFILGFSVVFVAIATLAGTLGAFVLRYEDVIIRAAGVIVIVLGLVFVGQFTFLQKTIKPDWRPRTGLAGAPLLGIIFAIGWTPCSGPALAAISALSLQGADPWRGALLGVVYCLGIGIPFIAIAAGLGWAENALGWVKRHIRAINLAGGAVLIAIGLLMVSGLWSLFVSWLEGLAFVTLV